MADLVTIVGFARQAYSLRRFREELRILGIDPWIVSPADLVPILRSDGVAGLGASRPMGVLHTWWGARGPSGAVLEAWEKTGTVVANTVAATQRAADKFAASAAMAAAGLPQLPSAVATDASSDAAAALALGFPLVTKPLGGSSGRNTHLVHNLSELRRAAQSSRPYDGFPLLLQRFVAEANGTDGRLFIVDGLLIGAIERNAAPGDFRSNVAQGASAKGVSPSHQEVDMAVAATRILGLDYAGVDVIATSSGPVILEVNGEPQYEALETATGANVAGAVVRWLTARMRRLPDEGDR